MGTEYVEFGWKIRFGDFPKSRWIRGPNCIFYTANRVHRARATTSDHVGWRDGLGVTPNIYDKLFLQYIRYQFVIIHMLHLQ